MLKDATYVVDPTKPSQGQVNQSKGSRNAIFFGIGIKGADRVTLTTTPRMGVGAAPLRNYGPLQLEPRTM